MDAFETQTSSRNTVSGGGKQRRRSGPRRKTGCYTCKARHASCDERKPVCSNCERLSLHCRPFEFIVRSAWCPTTGTGKEQLTAEERIGNTDDGGSAITTSLAQRTSQQNTTSTSCVSENNMESTGSGSSSSLSSRASSSPLLSVISSPVTAKTIPLPVSAEVAHLLSVYATGVATWMDIFDHTRSYQYEVPRRCLTSVLLTKCVCAFTAKQLSLTPSGEIWSGPAARYYGEALRLLIQHLDNSPGSNHGDALTANLLLSSYEMLEARSREHQRHLSGAATLIRMQGIDAQSQAMDRANFWIYARHDVTVALENETPPRLRPNEWNVDWRTREGDEDALGNQLLWLVARAVDIVYASEPPSPSNSALQDIQSEAAEWFDNLPCTFQGIKYGQPDDLGFVKMYFAIPSAAAAMIWYHLLIILLCAETTSQSSPCVPHIQYHASEIASIALSEIPSSVHGFSRPPLFFAAKHIDGIAKKTKLWAMLDSLETRFGLKTRSRIQKLQRLAEFSA